MSWRDRLRRLWWDLRHPAAGRIGVVEAEPTPEQRRAARLTVIPLLAGVLMYVLTYSYFWMFATTAVVAAEINLIWRAYDRAGS